MNGITIERVCIGVYLTALQLSDGRVGVSSTVTEVNSGRAFINRNTGLYSPCNIKGQPVSDLINSDIKTSCIESIRVAALSAISSNLITSQLYNIKRNVDPISIIDLKPGQRVAMVGAFRSYITKIIEASAELKVLEFNENAIQENYKKYFVPAKEYKRVISKSDIVIITGLTIANSTIDQLLSACKPNTKILLTGPSCGLIPDILFEKGVSIIGAAKIHNSNLLFEIVEEGGAGYHLFTHCAEKICIVNGFDNE